MGHRSDSVSYTPDVLFRTASPYGVSSPLPQRATTRYATGRTRLCEVPRWLIRTRRSVHAAVPFGLLTRWQSTPQPLSPRQASESTRRAGTARTRTILRRSWHGSQREHDPDLTERLCRNKHEKFTPSHWTLHQKIAASIQYCFQQGMKLLTQKTHLYQCLPSSRIRSHRWNRKSPICRGALRRSLRRRSLRRPGRQGLGSRLPSTARALDGPGGVSRNGAV